MFTINVSYIIEIAVLGNTHIFNEFHHLKFEHGTLLSGITHPTESTCESSSQIQLPTESGPITSYIVQKMHLLSQVFCDYHSWTWSQWKMEQTNKNVPTYIKIKCLPQLIIRWKGIQDMMLNRNYWVENNDEKSVWTSWVWWINRLGYREHDNNGKSNAERERWNIISNDKLLSLC